MNEMESLAEMVRAAHGLIAEYCACLDDERYECWPKLFTEDCIYQVIARDELMLGRKIGFLFFDSRKMLEDRITSLRDVNIFEPYRSRHITGPTTFDAGPAPSILRSRTPYAVYRIKSTGETDLFSTGEYRDEMILVGEEVLLRQRVVVCDSRRISDLLAWPL